MNQIIKIKRNGTPDPDHEPTTLAEGELAANINTSPAQLWIGGPGGASVIPITEPTEDAPSDAVYGRTDGNWVRAVAVAGDTMTGSLGFVSASQRWSFDLSGQILNLNRLNLNGSTLGYALQLNYNTGAVAVGSGGFSSFGVSNFYQPIWMILAQGGGAFINMRNNTPNAPVGIMNNSPAGARWLLNLGDGTPETGGNVGSNFGLMRYSDVGGLLGAALTIERATGNVLIPANVSGGTAPSAPEHLTTKAYVDAQAGLPINGGTLTGPLVLADDPIANMQAATKQYVDAKTAAGSSVVTVSLTPPVSPEPGAFWWDVASGQLFIAYQNFWIVASKGATGQKVPIGRSALSFPTTPTLNQIFMFWRWDGAKWGLRETPDIGADPPDDPWDGQLWWDSNDDADGGQMYVSYTDDNGQQWVATNQPRQEQIARRAAAARSASQDSKIAALEARIAQLEALLARH